jgi:hypothetical protein
MGWNVYLLLRLLRQLAVLCVGYTLAFVVLHNVCLVEESVL